MSVDSTIEARQLEVLQDVRGNATGGENTSDFVTTRSEYVLTIFAHTDFDLRLVATPDACG
ncbi:MAG: hypothetical protein R6X06_08360 [Gammaproteobacteria bacterium]